MSYLPRLNVDWVKCATKLRQNYSCCAATSTTIQSLNLISGARLFSTNVNPQIKYKNKYKERSKSVAPIKNEATVAVSTEPSKVIQKKKQQKSPIKERPLSVKKQREHVVKETYEELERVAREAALNRNLVSYLELCVFTGDLHRAIKVLAYYKSKGTEGVPDTEAFNVVLHGCAAKGDLANVKKVFRLLRDHQLPPSPQTYAAIFECLGRSLQTANCTRNVRITIESFKSCGFVLDDIFNDCIFERDQREMILAAIRKVEPNFEPQISTPFPGYVCSLLEKLNNVKCDPNYVSPANNLISPDEMLKNASQQFRHELEGQVTVASIEKKDITYSMTHYRKLLQDTEEMWKSVIKASLDRDLNSLQCQSQNLPSRLSITLFPFLKVLQPEDYVQIVLSEIKRLSEGSETFSPVVTQLYKELGTKVLRRYQILQKKEAGILEKLDKLLTTYLNWYLNPESTAAVNPRQKWQELLFDIHKQGPHVDVPEKVWQNNVLVNIGRFLYRIIMQDIKINVNIMKGGLNIEQLVPAFYSIYRRKGPHLKEEVKPHPMLVKLFQAASPDKLTFDTTLTPMICPPLPWSSVRTGGYLLSSAKIVRLPIEAHLQLHKLKSVKQENIYPALDSLNQLGAVPWKINEDILDIIIQVFNNKGNESIAIPPHPSECPQPPPIDPTMTKAEVLANYKQRVWYRRRRAEMYSLWCDSLYRLSLAHHFRKNIFWFPHNMDFRGRVYPCPPHLHHLGADPARAILVFAKGEPLGPRGLDWLKIHLVNLTGLKKRDSIHDRLKFANQIMDDILDSAENPLNGRKWWMQSEEPWQTLACCVEIFKALKSGDPESYISGFPIHQDGSCNGLQHYAALGRDEAGAKSVNLSPSKVPQDVYSVIASLVEKRREKDAEAGIEIARVLDGFVKRKVVKQTVMTTVYGVTRYGAKHQIAKQLKDITEFPKEHIWPASLYLTGATFDSLQSMFTSTKEIQEQDFAYMSNIVVHTVLILDEFQTGDLNRRFTDWFTICAQMISKVCGKNVEWVTPLGLPIVQPYIKKKRVQDLSNTVKLHELLSTDMYERPNVMKQKNAFPPNFIHSLDSSHMMLTSINAERAGITFVSVHDCFWTHPKTVHIMNQICREQFVALHSEPILQDLSKFFVDKYSFSDLTDESNILSYKQKLNRTVMDVPETGTFDLDNVLKSVYFFS